MIKEEVAAPVRGLEAAKAAVWNRGPNTPNIGEYRPVAVGSVKYTVTGKSRADDFIANMAVVFASKSEADEVGRGIGLRVFSGADVENSVGDIEHIPSDFEGIDPMVILAWADAEARKPWGQRATFTVVATPVERRNADGRKYTQKVRTAKASATVLEAVRTFGQTATTEPPTQGA